MLTLPVVEFLVGLYFVVADLPTVFVKPFSLQSSIRLVAGVLLVVFALLQLGVVR